MQFPPEQTQLPQPFVHQIDLPLELPLDVAAGELPGIVHRQTLMNVIKSQTEALEPPDEFQAPQTLLTEQAVTAFAAAHRRQQDEIFVVAEGLDRQTTAAGKGPDLHANGCHGLDSPPVGRL